MIYKIILICNDVRIVAVLLRSGLLLRLLRFAELWRITSLLLITRAEFKVGFELWLLGMYRILVTSEMFQTVLEPGIVFLMVIPVALFFRSM